MKPLPFPLRVAAGLVVTAAEQARELPKRLIGLPVTVVSQALQCSMRLQQQVTELAIKGEQVLSTFRPVEETPAWATFDEDLPPSAPGNGHRHEAVSTNGDPWEEEEHALGENHVEGEFDSAAGSRVSAGPAGLSNYDELTLPQLRARLRRFSLAELEELLAYERSHANRPSFIGMLTRRINNVQRLAHQEDE